MGQLRLSAKITKFFQPVRFRVLLISTPQGAENLLARYSIVSDTIEALATCVDKADLSVNIFHFVASSPSLRRLFVAASKSRRPLKMTRLLIGRDVEYGSRTSRAVCYKLVAFLLSKPFTDRARSKEGLHGVPYLEADALRFA